MEIVAGIIEIMEVTATMAITATTKIAVIIKTV
jgi:hypothetical protein